MSHNEELRTFKGGLSNELLNLCSEAIDKAREAGIKPNYFFIEEAYMVDPIKTPLKIYGLNVWYTKLPEGKKVVAVKI